MNDHELETLLSGLPPRGPSAALSQRVAKELVTDRQWMHTPLPDVKHRWLGSVSWAAAGAAAALLTMSLLSGPGEADTAPSFAAVPAPAVMPVTTIREVVSAENEGIHYNASSRLPEQRVRLLSVERHAWTDPRDGAQIILERPREESVVLPVSFQ
ncbi:hypothetical protein WJU23_01785 [Prosthecobacter sp. SYSU 5D2]|uniref:hypothetical protein n=1 Tax=Prosthecobacter sp. SYSU 5D2 TaxID=3134134 RepID=UPI0031FE6646